MSSRNVVQPANIQTLIVPAPRHFNFVDLTGRKFSRLEVIGFGGVGSTGKGSYWVCKCDCGKYKKVFGGHLCAGRTRSCGCLAIETIAAIGKALKTTHGGYYTPEYDVWRSIVARCENPKCKIFFNYGGRGITICKKWRNSFGAFLADVGKRPSANHSIDRINNNGNYEPGNCRWATRREQARNTRSNVRIEYGGSSRTLAEWSEIAGLPFQVIGQRLRRGWSPEKAISTPLVTSCIKNRGENHSRAKLTREQAKAIVLAIRSGDKIRDVASKYAVTTKTISSIVNGHSWIGLLDEL